MIKALTASTNPLRERFTEHDIRATHATMIEDIAGEEVASMQLGHDDRKNNEGVYQEQKTYCDYSTIYPYWIIICSTKRGTLAVPHLNK